MICAKSFQQSSGSMIRLVLKISDLKIPYSLTLFRCAAFLLFVLAAFPEAEAQDFRHAVPDREVALELSTDPGTFEWYRTDSIVPVVGGEIDYMNLILRDHAGCLRVDTGLLGDRIFRRDDNFTVLFNKEGDSIFYKNDHLPTEVWRFYTYPDGRFILAENWNQTTNNLLPGAYPDSLKVIRLNGRNADSTTDASNPWHFRTMGVNGVNGVWHFPSMATFPNGHTGNWAWVGISNPDTGRVNINARRAYDLRPGNEIHYRREYRSGNSVAFTDVLELEKRFVLSRTDSPAADSIHLEFFRAQLQITSMDGGAPDTVQIVDTMMESIALQDYNWLDALPMELMQRDGPGFTVHEQDSLFFGRARKHVYDFFSFSPSSCLEVAGDSLPELTYMDGLGVFHYYDAQTTDPDFNYEREDIVFYQKGLDEWGTRLDFGDLLSTSAETADALETVQLYPNPTQDVLIVQGPHQLPVRLEVFDMNGRLVQARDDQWLPVSVPVNWPVGTYMLRISTEEGAVTRTFLSR